MLEGFLDAHVDILDPVFAHDAHFYPAGIFLRDQ